MTAQTSQIIRVTQWQGGQHPTLAALTHELEVEGLRPYKWLETGVRLYPVRTSGATKVLCVAEGTLNLVVPDENRVYTLRAGDRAEIPAGARHGIEIGARGVVCVEATHNRNRAGASPARAGHPVNPYRR